MGYYMFQVAYIPEAVAGMIRKPEDRSVAVKAVVEKIGGKLEGIWFAFGEYDAVVIVQLPDNVSAVASAMVAASTGQFKAFKTTPLITMQESMEAMKKGGGIQFKAPGKP
jgi:uncharacterized protein with GYD domain